MESHIKWFGDYLLKWDLKDLGEDLESLKSLSEGKFRVSTSQRIRFHWRYKLEEHVERFKELEEIGKQKNWKSTPWEFFASPLSRLPTEILGEDFESQKLVIINEWIVMFWADIVSNYIHGIFASAILLCHTCIELMIKGIALRDDENLYEKIKGRPGFRIKTLMKENPETFEHVKKKMKRIETVRGNIIAHGIGHLEKARNGELWKILVHKKSWNQIKPLPESKAHVIIPFKNLAEETIKLTIEILDYLRRITLRTQGIENLTRRARN
jgi:hypothetical protein